MKKNIFLSVVVTALNEENNVESCVHELSAFLDEHVQKYEIIFVNDGSTDQTKERLDALKKTEHLKIIHLPFNKGTGGAIKAAMPQIAGDWYCWLPSDLEIGPEQLLAPLALVGNHDVVITHISNGHAVRTEVRNKLSMAFTAIMNMSFGTELKYFNGVSFIKTQFMKNQNIHANRFFFHAELLLKVIRQTKNVAEVPIVLTPRRSGLSSAMKPKIFLDVGLCFMRNFWELRIKNENPHY